jgi:hypothetical protein
MSVTNCFMFMRGNLTCLSMLFKKVRSDVWHCSDEPLLASSVISLSSSLPDLIRSEIALYSSYSERQVAEWPKMISSAS